MKTDGCKSFQELFSEKAVFKNSLIKDLRVLKSLKKIILKIFSAIDLY